MESQAGKGERTTTSQALENSRGHVGRRRREGSRHFRFHPLKALFGLDDEIHRERGGLTCQTATNHQGSESKVDHPQAFFGRRSDGKTERRRGTQSEREDREWVQDNERDLEEGTHHHTNADSGSVNWRTDHC